MSKPNTNTPQFTFVGSTESETTEKITWPVEAQAIVIRNKVIGGLSASASFEAGVAEYNELVASGEIKGEAMPTELPESYGNKNAGSVLYGLKQRFLKRVNDASARNHTETLAAAQQFGIVQPTETSEQPTDESEPEQADVDTSDEFSDED